jgi:hypothetical protein
MKYPDIINPTLLGSLGKKHSGLGKLRNFFFNWAV